MRPINVEVRASTPRLSRLSIEDGLGLRSNREQRRFDGVGLASRPRDAEGKWAKRGAPCQSHGNHQRHPMNAALASELRQLKPLEKLRLVEELWDEIASSEDQLPIPEWHSQVLAEDAVHYQNNANEGAPWPEVKARLQRKP